jgi:hypothetical protein
MGKSEMVEGQKYSLTVGCLAETLLMFGYGSSVFYPILFYVVGLLLVSSFIHQF